MVPRLLPVCVRRGRKFQYAVYIQTHPTQGLGSGVWAWQCWPAKRNPEPATNSQSKKNARAPHACGLHSSLAEIDRGQQIKEQGATRDQKPKKRPRRWVGACFEVFSIFFDKYLLVFFELPMQRNVPKLN
jgi:hypothetical protein